jgi:hypothetical protein
MSHQFVFAVSATATSNMRDVTPTPTAADGIRHMILTTSE